MRLLLDTHFVVWVSVEPSRVPEAAVPILNEPEAELWFSVASIWEVAIKTGLGRAGFKVDPNQLRLNLLANGYQELPITSDHVIAVADLPRVYGDPFDRLLVAQSMLEQLELVTCDSQLAHYGGPIRYFS
jgi:PIN domain nuclease of toxin-antitoxin system